MSKLDELLRELCPDGVEYKKLGEIATISRGGNFQKKDFLTEGVPCIHYGQIYTKYGLFTDKTFTFISEECAKKQKMAQPNDIVMAVTSENIEDVCKCLAWLGDEPVAVSGHSAIIHHNQNAKYLVYYFHSQMFFSQKRKLAHGTKVIEVTPDTLVNITLPVPPVEIQCEIVRILDNFTNLTAELTAELTARKTQYSHYRDKMLTFGDDDKFKWENLGDVCDILTGYPFDSSQFQVSGVRLMRGMNIKRGNLFFSEEINRYWNSADGLEKYLLKENDIVIAMDGSLVGKSFGIVQAEYLPLLLVQRVARIRSKQVNNRYIYHYIACRFPSYVEKKKTGGAIPHVSQKDIAFFRVPIPSADVQNRIVNVLDNFEKICSDLNIGLPAEIEARQKQYEYYRDKLLTFAENGNTILSRAEQSRAEQSRALIKLLQYVFGYAVVSLQDVVKNSCSGGTPKKGVSEYYEDGNIPWLRTQEVVFRDICKTECFITESAVKNSAAKWIPENCVIVAISGATAGRCAINKIPLTTNQHCLNLEVDPEMALYRYVYYCICAKQEELLAKKEGARGDLNSTRILSLQIDLPSIEEQKRIISILDRFDAICNDLTSGLPAEIEARQKQYEYYRDKLLTFKEVAAT